MVTSQIQVDFDEDDHENVVNRLNTLNISVHSIEPVSQMKNIDIELK